MAKSRRGIDRCGRDNSGRNIGFHRSETEREQFHLGCPGNTGWAERDCNADADPGGHGDSDPRGDANTRGDTDRNAWSNCNARGNTDSDTASADKHACTAD